PPAAGLPRGAGVRDARGERAPPPPLRSQQRLSRRPGRIRNALLRALPRRVARGDDRAARSPLVRRLPVPSRAEVPADASPPAVRGVHWRRPGAAPRRHRRCVPNRGRGLVGPGRPSRLTMALFGGGATPFLIAGPCVV